MSQPAHKPASYYGTLDSFKWSLTLTLNNLLYQFVGDKKIKLINKNMSLRTF